MPPERRFLFRPRAFPMLLAAVFFGVAAVFYVWRALTNDRGLIINHLIELEPGGAATFYWVLALASLGFVAIGLFGLISRLKSPRYVVFDREGLTVPSRFRRDGRRVSYDAIRGFAVIRVASQDLLELTTDSGNVTIAGIMLESKSTLSEVVAELEARLAANAARAKKPF